MCDLRKGETPRAYKTILASAGLTLLDWQTDEGKNYYFGERN